jgi:hypothetical protein
VPNQFVAAAAHQFLDAANLLFKTVPDPNYVLPLHMVASFGVELYLKALNSNTVFTDAGELEGEENYFVTACPEVRSHSLSKLYGSLADGIRKSIEEANSVSNGNHKAKSVKAALDLYDNVFVNSRYPFQSPNRLSSGSINGLVSLLRFLSVFVDKLLES